MGLLDVKSGQITTGSGTGIVTVSGLGFTPKIVIVTATYNGVYGLVSQANFSIGFMDNAGTAHCNWSADADNRVSPNTTNCYRGRRTDRIVYFTNGIGTVIAEASYQSMSSGQFQINVLTNLYGGAMYWGYTAIGGDAVEDWDIENFSLNTGSAVTTRNLGYTPDFLLCCSHMGTNNDAVHSLQTIGFFDGTNQRTACTWSEDNVIPSVCTKVLKNSFIMTRLVGTSSTENYTAAFISGATNGYTLTQSGGSNNAYRVIALAIKGDKLRFKVGDFDELGSLGTQKFSTTFPPSAALGLLCGGNYVFGTVYYNAVLSFGHGTSNADTFTNGYRARNGMNTTDTENNADSNDFLTRIRGSSSDFFARQEIQSFQPDGIILEETLAGSAGVKYLIAVMGLAPQAIYKMDGGQHYGQSLGQR